MSAVCVEDFHELARQRLDPSVWDFINGGSGAEVTLTANRSALQQIRLRPRGLVDVGRCTTATLLLGAELATPLGVAPTAYHRLAHPDGEVATARAAGAVGALFVVSMFASRTVEEIAAAGGPLWFQLYWLTDRPFLADLVDRVSAAGYRALVLTVDAPVLGRRRRDLRNGFAIPDGVQAVNLRPRDADDVHQSEVGRSAVAAHAAATFDRTITWSDLAWLRERSPIPVLVKGVLTAEDARLAVQSGVSGIIVSNHGGRQLDGAPASIHALPEVIAEVGGHCPVLFDGGVREGRDVFAALAFGAAAVLVGRPVLWGLAADGEQGAQQVLQLLHEELVDTMMLTGKPRLELIDSSALATPQGRAGDRAATGGGRW